MVPGLTSWRARSAAACFCASTSADAVVIYLIEPLSARIDGMGRLMESVPGRVIRKFLEDQAPNWAALIAWNALLAMFPIVIFAASLLGFALRLFGAANDAVYKTIFSAFPGDPQQQTELVKAVSGVKSQSGLLFIVGLGGLLLGGSALFGVMEQAFAVIYHTKPRDFVRQKLIAFGMVFLFTILVGVAVATSAILPALKQIPDMPLFLYSGRAVATPESGPEGERVGVGGRRLDRNGQVGNGAARDGRRGIPARAALGMAVVASLVGVLLGRRSASSD